MEDDHRKPKPSLNPYAVEASGASISAPLPESFLRSLSGIPILGALMILHGIGEIVAAIAAGTYGLLLPQFTQQMGNQANAPVAAFPGWLHWYPFVIALILLVLGILSVVCGANVLRYRGRTLAMVSLFSGLMTLLTCYCFPTALALTIYGLIVLLNPSVKLAFDVVKHGHNLPDLTAIDVVT